MTGEERVEVTIDGRTLSLSNLSKVMYPAMGFTKAEVIDYYVNVAPVILDHIRDRGITLIRFPDGVDGKSFFSKRCVDYRPPWINAVEGPGHTNGEPIEYCQLAEPAALAWTANLAGLEIHAPMARSIDIERPTIIVFDLDPGLGTDICDCARIALLIRDLLDHLGLVCFPKTSGSKGMQLYLPINDGMRLSHEMASEFALALAQLLEKQHPNLVITKMSRAARDGRIFIDWSQNSRHKTTVAPYSLRAKHEPTVSTPLRWDEVEASAAGSPASFTSGEVLDRIEAHGDLFGEVVTLDQELPKSILKEIS